MDAQLRARLKSFAESLQGPLGMIPLDRAIRADLDLFRMLKASGATWIQVSNALAIAGVRSPNGNLLSADHLRSTISRQLKRSRKEDANVPSGNTYVQHPAPYIASEISNSITNLNTPNNDDDQDSSIYGKNNNKENNLIMQKLARTRSLRET